MFECECIGPTEDDKGIACALGLPRPTEVVPEEL
jgi:hypothetical protein